MSAFARVSRLLCAILSLCVFASVGDAHAGDGGEAAWLAVPQPEVVPRRFASTLLIELYMTPEGTDSLEEAALREAAEREYRRAFAHDARSVFADIGPERLADLAEAQERESDRLLARQLELGRQLYRIGDLEEATRAIEQAMSEAAKTDLRWSRKELLADSLETLALAYQEMSAAPGARALELESQTRLALRDLIRLRPHAKVDEWRYPQSFVEAWRQAYFEQLVVSAAVLALRIEEARSATRLLDVDVIADLRLMYGPRGASFALRMYDAVSDRFAYDGILPWDGSPEHLEEQLSRAFSVARECMRLERPKATSEKRRRLHSNYLSAESVFFTYLDRPTDRPFLNSGFRLGGHHYVTPVVGFYAEVSVTFSSRDRSGILLEPIQLQSLTAGLSLQYERSRLRLFFDVGGDISRRTDLVATRSFWCRVSGGQPVAYDNLRQCREDEVFRQRASGLVGVNFKGGMAVRLVGPVWATAGVHSTVYLVPFGNRGVDRPIGASAGFAYGF